tara:strand:- start:1613 stop:3352 length:1740 start_codon:yes stop_codon:yes gene_type:complete
MIKLLHLSKFIQFSILFTLLVFDAVFASTAINIWEKKENNSDQVEESDLEEKIKIESPILSDDVEKITIEINEQTIEDTDRSVIGIFDPEDNNFSLQMWSQSDGNEIKKILKRINNLKLSGLSDDLLFQVLFTNAYPPKKNLNGEEFLKIKIDWLIKNRRHRDLETLLQKNPEVGQHPKAIKFLVNEYLSSAEIKLACEKVAAIGKEVQNDYLDKFQVYCLLNNDREDEAQMLLDLLREKGMKDNFFDNKINFLLGITENTSQKILDDNLLNFYLSHITSDKFEYEPNEKTDKYIWRYLSAANLIKIDVLENEDVISKYEKAAAQNAFNSEEIFNTYKQILFSINQLLNATEVYKNMPKYKARALIYQKILLSEDVEKKIYLAFLLKDLFKEDKLSKVYSDELTNILKSIDAKEIPDNYEKLVKENLEKKASAKKIKFDNDILHRSKVIKHFLDDEEKLSRTEKDFKSVYKKIKRNKKYFISIKDIIVLDSLKIDGITLPKDLDYSSLSSELTVPQSLEDLASRNEIGLVMLKIIEIIGEDDIHNLDPETIYFLNVILNKLDLKKIRNNILSEALPVKV